MVYQLRYPKTFDFTKNIIIPHLNDCLNIHVPRCTLTYGEGEGHTLFIMQGSTLSHQLSYRPFHD